MTTYAYEYNDSPQLSDSTGSLNADENGAAELQSIYSAPISATEEPLYVNARQYHRILKRRIQRAKLEQLEANSKQKQPYKHESRHKHAMRRPRGTGGRFLTKQEILEEKERKEREGIEKGSSDESLSSSSETPSLHPLSHLHPVPPHPPPVPIRSNAVAPHAIAPRDGGQKRKRTAQQPRLNHSTSYSSTPLSLHPSLSSSYPSATQLPNTYASPSTSYSSSSSSSSSSSADTSLPLFPPTTEINSHFTTSFPPPSSVPSHPSTLSHSPLPPLSPLSSHSSLQSSSVSSHSSSLPLPLPSHSSSLTSSFEPNFSSNIPTRSNYTAFALI